MCTIYSVIHCIVIKDMPNSDTSIDNHQLNKKHNITIEKNIYNNMYYN